MPPRARARSSPPDWGDWLRRWDAQQESFNPEREQRFSVMFDVAEALVGRRFRALDLGCGPGSLSVRLLRRFPAARVVAVDYDPVSLRVGRGAVGSVGGRLHWVDAKLGAPGWTRALPAGRFDAAFSTTALHWLKPRDLAALYRDLGRRIRPGGVFLNGDRLWSGPSDRFFSGLSEKVRTIRFGGKRRASEWTGWNRWWRDAERLPELAPLFTERARRSAQHPKDGDTPLEAQIRYLRRAGFRQIRIVWGDLENRVLLARR